MISEQNKKLAQWALKYALNNGCQAAKINVYANSISSVDIRDGKIDSLKQATEEGMSINLYVEGRFGSCSTNRLDKAELEKFIKTGIDSTKYLEKDDFRKLPDPSRYYKGGLPDLQLYHTELNTLSPDEKVKLAIEASEEVLGKDTRIVSVESSFGDEESSNYMITSNGFEGESKRSYYSLSVSVSVKGESDARPSSYWYDSSLSYDKLIKQGIGKKALERTLEKLGQQKVKSGKYTMILDPMNSSRLLTPMISALNGSAIQQKNSFLMNKLDQKVGSDLFTLRDEPHLISAFGARYFDFEGAATSKRTIFDKGVLNTFFI